MREPLPKAPRIGLESTDPDLARFPAGRDLIQYLSDVHSLTYVELAHRCGVPREQVSRWLRGEHQPSLASLTRVLDALGWRLVLGLEPKTGLDRDDGVS